MSLRLCLLTASTQCKASGAANKAREQQLLKQPCAGATAAARHRQPAARRCPSQLAHQQYSCCLASPTQAPAPAPAWALEWVGPHPPPTPRTVRTWLPKAAAVTIQPCPPTACSSQFAVICDLVILRQLFSTPAPPNLRADPATGDVKHHQTQTGAAVDQVSTRRCARHTRAC